MRQRIQEAEEKLARTMPEPAARERQAQLNTEAELLERFDLLKLEVLNGLNKVQYGRYFTL